MSNVSANLEALGEPRRRKLFELLVYNPASVGELAKQLPDVTRSAISQHLRVLVDAHLIRYQTVGSRNIYQVDADGLTVLRNYFDSLWGHALRDLKSLAEESHLKKKHQTPHRSRKRPK